jgi:hypothetical protein
MDFVLDMRDSIIIYRLNNTNMPEQQHVTLKFKGNLEVCFLYHDILRLPDGSIFFVQVNNRDQVTLADSDLISNDYKRCINKSPVVLSRCIGNGYHKDTWTSEVYPEGDFIFPYYSLEARQLNRIVQMLYKGEQEIDRF